MSVEVALAMAEQQGRWLLQLRDDIEGIVHPGTWGLFGGHLDPGETPEQALRRELREEIRWEAQALSFWFLHHNPQRDAHFFRTTLAVSLKALDLREGQDLTLASLEELRTGSIWSPRRRESRPLAPSLQRAVEKLVEEAWLP
ncbi:NUDIX domain-containing protein [Synechococcus sp. ATX 2A4]|uniref:NUDIX hydrolase n=1 Tax=Synechococcus sp. ATX 2A4 TaxID=2823727 RepID=UPI0020CCE020|nr:NUDIX domain-containing protein [Synechococcus sp. ATX 2A4]MCP9883740.1 NUDIX domain-containing protein [Synechococcus sp. ATX 2A4]